jgi:response regulator NasT
LSGLLTAFSIVDSVTPRLGQVLKSPAGAPALGRRPSSTPSPPTAPPDYEEPSAVTADTSKATDEVEQLRAEADALREMIRIGPTIEQAKGLLMARHRCDAEQAWAVLDQVSQSRNVKVRDLAAAVTRAAQKDANEADTADRAPPQATPPPHSENRLRRRVRR